MVWRDTKSGGGGDMNTLFSMLMRQFNADSDALQNWTEHKL
jgi:hypothetical protein